MPLDPTFEKAVRDRLSRSAFREWMGLELVSIEDGSCEVRFPIRPHHLNPGGVVHGGVLATLLDGAIGLALRTKIGADETHVTLELTVHYLSPARDGVIVARGKAVQGGKRTSYGEAELLTEDGRLIARGAATFLTVPGRETATPRASGS